MSSSSESSSLSLGRSAIWSSMADETIVAVGAAVAAAHCGSSQSAGAGVDRRFVRKDCAGAISFGAASGCIAAGGARLLVGRSGNASSQQTSGLCHLSAGGETKPTKKKVVRKKGKTKNLLPTQTSFLRQILLKEGKSFSYSASHRTRTRCLPIASQAISSLSQVTENGSRNSTTYLFVWAKDDSPEA